MPASSATACARWKRRGESRHLRPVRRPRGAGDAGAPRSPARARRGRRAGPRVRREPPRPGPPGGRVRLPGGVSPRARARGGGRGGGAGGVGGGVRGPGVGERVLVIRAVTWGACPACRRGDDNLCATRETFGVNRPGGYAESIVTPARNVWRLPPTLGFEEAAAVQVAFSTAWHLLIERAGLRAGGTVLLTAAGRGGSRRAVQ